MERRPLGEATNIGACVTFKCPDDEFVELAGAHAELEQELAAERQKTAALKLEVLELQQQNEVMKRHVLGFQLATGFATAPFAIERRDDAIVEGVTRRTARVMRTVPLALAVPPAEQQSWPGHLDPVAWAPPTCDRSILAFDVPSARRREWHPSFGPRSVSGFDPKQSPALAPGK